jgi:hypothetical protein
MKAPALWVIAHLLQDGAGAFEPVRRG